MLDNLISNLKSKANIEVIVGYPKSGGVRVSIEDISSGMVLGTCVDDTVENSLITLITHCVKDTRLVKLGGKEPKLSEL